MKTTIWMPNRDFSKAIQETHELEPFLDINRLYYFRKVERNENIWLVYKINETYIANVASHPDILKVDSTEYNEIINYFETWINEINQSENPSGFEIDIHRLLGNDIQPLLKRKEEAKISHSQYIEDIKVQFKLGKHITPFEFHILCKAQNIGIPPDVNNILESYIKSLSIINADVYDRVNQFKIVPLVYFIKDHKDKLI